MRPKTDVLADVIGAFDYPISAPPPLVSSRLRALIDELAKGSYQSCPAPRLWNALNQQDFERADHSFINVNRTIDGWDKSASEINKMTRKDGTVWYALGRMQVIDDSAIDGVHLWRDAVTHTVLCSELFRERAIAMKLTNIGFRALRVAA